MRVAARGKPARGAPPLAAMSSSTDRPLRHLAAAPAAAMNFNDNLRVRRASNGAACHARPPISSCFLSHERILSRREILNGSNVSQKSIRAGARAVSPERPVENNRP